jgi:uncharacterized membrane protein YeiH
MIEAADSRARGAQLTLEQNRAELRAVFAAKTAGVGGGFPRSATFRWLTSHLNARSLASTALAALMVRSMWAWQLLGGWLRRSA